MKRSKIYLIGPVGSGKTTLAKHLSKKLNIPMYELDTIVFDDANGNRKRTKEEIDALFLAILKQKSWIIEDVGRKAFLKGIEEADIVYYLDLPEYLIYKRCILRWIRQKRNKEIYHYKPTISSLFQMLGWARDNVKKKKQKIGRIKEHAKQYQILNLKEINELEKE